MIETVVLTELVTTTDTDTVTVVESVPELVETDTLTVVVATEHTPEVIEVSTP